MKLKTWLSIGTLAFTAWRGYRGMKRNVKKSVRHNAKTVRHNAKSTLRRAAKAI